MIQRTTSLLSGPGLGLALDGPVRSKGRKPLDIRSYAGKLMRVAKKAPEVVVKVSGSGKKPGQILAHMTYITRNGKLEAENERGEAIKGLAEVQEVFQEWSLDSSKASTRGRAQTVNIVLSMPEGTDPQAVLAASRGFAKEQFGGNHQYLLALHTDTRQPHVHLAVKAQGFGLTWLKRSKADLQEWRECFAQKMRDQGLEAEATPRRARGVIRKAKTQAINHLAKEPKRSTVMKAKVDDVIREIDGQTPAGDRPWDRAIVERQRKVRNVYHAVATELRGGGDQLSRDVGEQVAGFLASLPPVETERAKLRRQVEAMMSVERTPERTEARQQAKSGLEAPIDDLVRGKGGRAR